MLFKWALILACIFGSAALPEPALADISVLYEYRGGFEDEEPDKAAKTINYGITIEVNDEGDARIHTTGRSSYLLVKSGEVYVVHRGIDGDYAESYADLDKVLKARGEVGGISFELFDMFEEVEILETGPFYVGGREGQGYSLSDGSGEGREAHLVLSSDPELEAIGGAFRAAFSGKYGIAKTIALAGVHFSLSFAPHQLTGELFTGAPLQLGYLELTEVNRDPIDPKRFKLPERVLTEKEINDYLEPFTWAPAFDRQPKDLLEAPPTP